MLYSILWKKESLSNLLEKNPPKRFRTNAFNEISEIIVDFLEIDGIRNAVSRIREVKTDLRVVVASPRIIKVSSRFVLICHFAVCKL